MQTKDYLSNGYNIMKEKFQQAYYKLKNLKQLVHLAAFEFRTCQKKPAQITVSETVYCTTYQYPCFVYNLFSSSVIQYSLL